MAHLVLFVNVINVCINGMLNVACKLRQMMVVALQKVMFDHIINAGSKLKVYLSFLFTSMLCYGISPEGMLLIKWNNDYVILILKM